MAPEDLHALTERLLDTARERFLGDGAHESIAYLHVRGVTTFIAVKLSAAEDRAVVRRIFEAAAREGAEACALVTEARSGTGETLLVVEAASRDGHTLRELIVERTREGTSLRAKGPADPGASPLLAGLLWPGRSGPVPERE